MKNVCGRIHNDCERERVLFASQQVMAIKSFYLTTEWENEWRTNLNLLKMLVVTFA